MNATIYSSSRVSFALGRTGFLPDILSRINEKRRTPHYSIFFSYLIISVMAMAPIEAVASVADIMFLILFVLVNFVLILLRFRRPDLKRTFRVPLVPYLPFFAIAAQIIIGYFLITELEHGMFVISVTVFWIILGSLIYFAYSEKEKIQKMLEETRTVYEEVPLESKGFRVLVPVANPVMAENLTKFAGIVAEERGGEIVLLNVVKLPPQTPFSVGTRYVEKSKEFIREIIAKTEVPAGGIIKVGHRAPEAILNAVEEIKPDLIVLGWRGRTFRKDFVLGSTIDPIMLRAKCDAVVIRFAPRDLKKIERILIPTIGGPHSALAIELARDIARHENAIITLMYVGKRKEEENRANKVFENASELLSDLNFEKKFVVSEHPVKVIVKEAENFDIIMVGATNEPFLKNFLMGVFPEKIVKKTSKTVVMTRRWVKIVDVLKK
jgi:nucleotide-binding universal stress UspA family protein